MCLSGFLVGTVDTRGLAVVVVDIIARGVAEVGALAPGGELWCPRVLWFAG